MGLPPATKKGFKMGLLGLRYKLNHGDAFYDQRDVVGYFRKKYSGSKQSKNTVVILATKGNGKKREEGNEKDTMQVKSCSKIY